MQLYVEHKCMENTARGEDAGFSNILVHLQIQQHEEAPAGR